jgi:hypothetical protein
LYNLCRLRVEIDCEADSILMILVGNNQSIAVTAQTNSTHSDTQKIIVTWMEKNDTKTIDSPMISVSGEDFWKIFESLLKQSINGSASLFE